MKIVDNFRKKIKRQEVIVKNFSFLSILQFAQLFISFILYPYLIKVLESHNYGVIIYSQTVVGYFQLILNFGFNYTSTRQISIHRNDKKELSKIISATYFSKMLIFTFLGLLYLAIIKLTPFLKEFELIYYGSFLALFGWLLYPEWYFQGVEKMENITYVMLTSRLISLLLIFTFVKNSEHFFYVPFINSLSIILAGVLGFYLMIKDLKSQINFHFSLAEVKNQMKQSSAVFLSNITANTKDYFNTIIIGALLSYSAVAIYDLANKIIKILIVPSSILYRVVFPKVSMSKSLNLVSKVEKITFIYTTVVLIILFLLPIDILSLIIDNDLHLFKSTLITLGFSLPLLSICGSRGYLMLIAFNRERQFTYGIIISVASYFLIVGYFYLSERVTIFNISLSLVFSLVIELSSHIYFSKTSKNYA